VDTLHKGDDDGDDDNDDDNNNDNNNKEKVVLKIIRWRRFRIVQSDVLL
jgi:hypothetical protein